MKNCRMRKFEAAPDTRQRSQPDPWAGRDACRLFVERSSDCMLVVDRGTNNIKYSNPATSELLGHAPKHLSELEAHNSSSMEEFMGRVGAEGTCEERGYMTKDGTVLMMDVRAEMVDEETILLISRDSSGRKKAEQHKWLPERMAILSLFIRGYLHDVGSMLTTIIGNADYIPIILESGELGNGSREKIKRYAGEIKAAADRINSMRQGLYGMVNGAPKEPNSYSVKRILDNIIPLVRKPGLEIIMDIPDSTPLVRVVHSNLSRTIENLFRNTIQATEELRLGSSTTKISAEDIYLDQENQLSLKPGRYVMITFSDDAGGIPADVLPSIFEAGFSTKGRCRGTGLAISRLNVRECGGEITVESQENHGTTFRIYLPACDEEAVEEKKMTGDFRSPFT